MLTTLMSIDRKDGPAQAQAHIISPELEEVALLHYSSSLLDGLAVSLRLFGESGSESIPRANDFRQIMRRQICPSQPIQAVHWVSQTKCTICQYGQ